MEQIKKTIRCGRIGKSVTDQFYVDEDINLPEAKSDAERIICGSGRVHVEEIRMADHYAKVSGRISWQILYEAQEEERGMAAVTGRIPFEELVYTDEMPESQLFVKSASAEVSVSLINSRKFNLKASVDMEIGSQGEQEVSITTDVEEEGLYKKFMQKDILRLHAVKKDVLRIKEEVSLPSGKENIGELLFWELELRKMDTRLESDVLVLRGDLQVFCLYETADMKTEWCEQSLPFEGRLECPGAAEDMYHCVYGALVDDNIEARMDEDGEFRIFGLEASLEVRYFVYAEESMEILEDLYAPGRRLIPSGEEVYLESLVMQNRSVCRVAEQLSLPELRDGALQICHSGGFLQIESAEAEEGILKVEGVLNVRFMYVKADDRQPFEIWQGMVPFAHEVECAGVKDPLCFDLSGSLEQLSVSLLGSGQAEVKASLAFQVFARKPERMWGIGEVKEEPFDIKKLENAPGIVGYIMKQGDTLWDLAKKYNTTEERIRRENDMAEGEPKEGDRILIFKENMGIL